MLLLALMAHSRICLFETRSGYLQRHQGGKDALLALFCFRSLNTWLCLQGFIWSGKAGSGVVTARLPDGSWSAPSCIATGGVGFGFQVNISRPQEFALVPDTHPPPQLPQIGADISEFVVVMNSEEAVRSFGLAGNLTVGGSLSATAGPIGTGGAVQAAVAHPAPMFSYSRSKGLFAGVSLEGVALIERKDANREFYGQPIPAIDLLSGKVPAPEAASAMYDVIEAVRLMRLISFARYLLTILALSLHEQAEQIDETGVAQQAYVPSAPPATTGAAATEGRSQSVPLESSRKCVADSCLVGYTLGGSAPAGATQASQPGNKPIFDA